MEKKIFTGKTAEDAIAAGLAQLGIAREDAEIEVIDEGKKGLFGLIGNVPAQVAIAAKEKLTDGQRAVRFLEGLLPLLGAEATPTLTDEDEKIVISLDAETAKAVIGRRGEVIDAIQTLAGAVANTGRKDYKRVVVDCENYREEREETLKRVAEKLAAKAVRLGKRVRLEPMNPYERRIIHSTLAESEEVTTRSEGKEPARYVVITPKNLKKFGGRGRKEDGKKDFRGRNGDRNGRDLRGGKDRKFEKKPYKKRELPAEGTPETSGTSINRGSSTPGYKKGGFSGFFGTFLGNSRDDEAPSETPSETAPSAPADPSAKDDEA